MFQQVSSRLFPRAPTPRIATIYPSTKLQFCRKGCAGLALLLTPNPSIAVTNNPHRRSRIRPLRSRLRTSRPIRTPKMTSAAFLTSSKLSRSRRLDLRKLPAPSERSSSMAARTGRSELWFYSTASSRMQDRNFSAPSPTSRS